MQRSNLFNYERWEKVNEINKTLMTVHMRNLKTNKRRPKTISQYYYDLRMFFCWNQVFNNNMSVLDFKKRHFDDFKFFLIEERNCSNARIDRLMSAIRTMMSYAEDDDDEYESYIRNVATKVRSLGKSPVKDVNFLSDEQIILLREHLKENGKYKLLLLLDLFYDSGGRISEVMQVKNVESLLNGCSNKVILKGGGTGYLLLHERSIESLKLYSQQIENSEYIWLKHDGSVVTTETTIRAWVTALRDILNEIQDKPIYFTPHSFRHSMIENLGNGTHYLCKKAGRAFTLEEIAILTHHKSTDVTKSYMKPKGNEIVFNLFGINLG